MELKKPSRLPALKMPEKSSVISFLLLNLGLFLTALGISLFKTPNHFAIGGVSGLAILANYFFPKLDVGLFMAIINVVFILLALITIGRDFGSKTIYSSFALSFYVSLCSAIFPMTAPFTQDTMLELCFAILLPAVGSAIVFNLGASTGGTDILAKILNKYVSLEIGKCLFVSDFLITLGSCLAFGIRTGLYCILGLIVKASLVDVVIDSINVRKCVVIISKEYQAIEDFIVRELHRGATTHVGYGAYSHEEKEVITTVLSRRQAVLLRNFIRRTDPHAFITITNSSEIIGKGFRSV